MIIGWLHKQTKTDLADVKDDLSVRITDVKTDLKDDIARAEDKLLADIGEVRGDLVHLKDNLLMDALKRARNPAATTQLSEASLQQPPLQPKQLAEISTPY